MRIVAVGLLVALASAGSQVHAEPPTLTRLFPSGAQAGTSVDVEYSGKPGKGEIRFWSSRPDVVWVQGEKENQLRVVVSDDAEPGLAWMRIIGSDGVSAIKPFVIGGVVERIEAEPNDSTAELEPVESLPCVMNGVLSKRGDVDHYRVAVQAGQTLVAGIQAERELQSEVDASLQIVDEHGHVLAQNLDYHGLDPLLVWTAARDQLVSVRVFGFPAAPDSTIALAGGENYLYRLSMTTGAWCEGALPLAVSSTQPTHLKAIGWNLPEPASYRIDPQPEAGEHYAFSRLGIEGIVSLPVRHLPFTNLPVVTVSGVKQVDSPSTLIELPAVVCGNMRENGQIDSIEFEVEANSKWSISLEARQLGYPLDAVLSIEDVETGKQLVEVDDANRRPDPEVQWIAPATGRYRLNIRDINGVGLPHNLYRLWLRPPEPSFLATVSETAFVAKVGELLEIPVTVERRFGFDQRLEIALQTEIPGIAMSAAVSEPGGETDKEVKVRLTANQAMTTSLRMIARVLPKESSSSSEAVTASQAVVDATSRIDELWLTAQ